MLLQATVYLITFHNKDRKHWNWIVDYKLWKVQAQITEWTECNFLYVSQSTKWKEINQNIIIWIKLALPRFNKYVIVWFFSMLMLFMFLNFHWQHRPPLFVSLRLAVLYPTVLKSTLMDIFYCIWSCLWRNTFSKSTVTEGISVIINAEQQLN